MSSKLIKTGQVEISGQDNSLLPILKGIGSNLMLKVAYAFCLKYCKGKIVKIL